MLKTEEYENELDEIVTRDDKSIQILTKVEHVLHKIKIKESKNIPPVQKLTLQDNEAKDIPVKLEISKFNGNILNWQGFCDEFNSAIHTKTNILDIDHAVQLLQEHYGNTQILINAYLKKFVTIPPVKNDRDVCSLRKLYIEVEASVRNLRSLNVDTLTYGSLLVQIYD